MTDTPDPPPTNTVAELFWSAAEPPSSEITPHDVVLHALLALRAFDAGKVRAPGTDKPLRLMSLVAEMGMEEDLVYASPEVVRGESFDVRALVFTIGVLIFERLTDRHPFGTSDNPTRIARLRRGEMGSGVNYLPSVPKDLRAILMRAMGPFPEERYGAVSELMEALAQFVERPDLAVHSSADDVDGAEQPLPGARLSAAQPAQSREHKPPTGEVARLRQRRPPSREVSQIPETDDGSRVAGAPRARESVHELPASDLADILEPEDEGTAPIRGRGARETAQVAAYGRPPPTPADPAQATGGRSKWTPLIYALVGAAVASALFLLVGRGRGRRAGGGAGRASATARPAPPGGGGGAGGSAGSAAPGTAAPGSAAPGSAAPGSAAPGSAAPGSAAPGSARGAASGGGAGSGDAPKTVALKTAPKNKAPAANPPASASGDSPGVAAGKRVVAAIAPCKLRRGGARALIVSVYMQAGRSRAVRGFVSRLPWMKREQVRCVTGKLAGLEVGIALPKAGYIEWSIRLRRDGGAAVRVRKPKRLR